jgi:hypothetical protein
MSILPIRVENVMDQILENGSETDDQSPLSMVRRDPARSTNHSALFVSVLNSSELVNQSVPVNSKMVGLDTVPNCYSEVPE